MRYKIITMEGVKPWYVLQEIYARLVRDKLLDISPDLRIEFEKYDELQLPTEYSKQLRREGMKSGFLDFPTDVPVACEEGKPGCIDVYEPTPKNIYRSEEGFLILPLCIDDRKIFTLYSHLRWTRKRDLETIETNMIDVNIMPTSPYFRSLENLIENFMHEKDIVLLRGKKIFNESN